jgi:hypothetical protein
MFDPVAFAISRASPPPPEEARGAGPAEVADRPHRRASSTRHGNVREKLVDRRRTHPDLRREVLVHDRRRFVRSSLAVSCGTTGGGGLGSHDTRPQSLTAAIRCDPGNEGNASQIDADAELHP